MSAMTTVPMPDEQMVFGINGNGRLGGWSSLTWIMGLLGL